MDYQSLHMKTVVELRRIAKDNGVKVPAGTNKNTLIELILEADQASRAAKAEAPAAKGEAPAAKTEAPAAKAETQAAKAEAPAAKAEAPAAKAEAPAAKAEAPAAKAEAPAAKAEAPAAKAEAPAAKAETPVAKTGEARPEAGQAALRRRGRPPKARPEQAAQPAGKAQDSVAQPKGEAEAAPAASRSAESAGEKGAAAEASTARPTPAAPNVSRSAESAGEKGAAAEASTARPMLAAPNASRSAENAGEKGTSAEAAARPTPAAPNASRSAESAGEKGTSAEAAARPTPAGEAARPRQLRNPAPEDARPGVQGEGRDPARTRAGEQGRSADGSDRGYRSPYRQGENPQRAMVRGRTAEPFHAVARPAQAGAAEANPRQGARGFAPRTAGYAPQGEARTQRYGNQAGYGQARSANPRYSRPADAPHPAEAQRPAEAAQPDSAQGETPRFERQAQRPEGYYNAEYKTSNPAVPEMLANGECGDGAGVLEIQPDGYGFLRAENCLPGPNDVYISIAQIRRFNLRNGDHVAGKTRPQREGDRYSAILYITQINGEAPEKAAERPRFEDLVPIYPDERLRLEGPGGKADLSLRLIDMLAPIGKGQRGMIVSQPKAGKTTLLKKVANAITAQYPDVHLIVLLIDERPEEVTDMKRSIDGEVIYSTFDEEPEHHTRVSEMVLERAQRLVEMGKDVVVLLDSITRLARAYNLTITPTGRSLSGGLDPGALFRPKRFFGAARNIENGGSLTIIATALVETGSRMDDIIFEEFKGTGNMELHLDRKLSDRRVFPAIDLLKSGTRREELLLSESEINGEYQVRRMLNGRQQEMYEQLIELLTKTATNAEFFDKLKGWLAVYEKGGYTMGNR